MVVDGGCLLDQQGSCLADPVGVEPAADEAVLSRGGSEGSGGDGAGGDADVVDGLAVLCHGETNGEPDHGNLHRPAGSDLDVRLGGPRGERADPEAGDELIWSPGGGAAAGDELGERQAASACSGREFDHGVGDEERSDGVGGGGGVAHVAPQGCHRLGLPAPHRRRGLGQGRGEPSHLLVTADGAVGGSRADAQVAVGGDSGELGDRADVDDDRRIDLPPEVLDHEVGPAGQHLGVAPEIGEEIDGLVDTSGRSELHPCSPQG
jgi:hypothetical protein